MASRMRVACVQALKSLNGNPKHHPLIIAAPQVSATSDSLFNPSSQLPGHKGVAEHHTLASLHSQRLSFFDGGVVRKAVGSQSFPPNVGSIHGDNAATLGWKRDLRTEVAKEVSVNYLEGDLKGVVTVSLERPAAKNALGKALLQQLRDGIKAVYLDTGVRAMILCSTVPKVFCAGADLKERKELTQEEVQETVRQLGATFKSLEDLQVPTIAAIEGHALGGGLELALACDLRVGGQNARLGLPETGLAIIPGAGGTQRLPRLIGVSKAKELIFTGRVVDAQEAYRIGLINHIVGPGEAFEKALELAAEILKKGPVAIRAAKLAISSGTDTNLVDGLKVEQSCYAMTLSTSDRLEGLAAFAEKRAPTYSGS